MKIFMADYPKSNSLSVYGISVRLASGSVEMGLRPSNRDENPLAWGGQSWPQPAFGFS
jgi:hypothetical protein